MPPAYYSTPQYVPSRPLMRPNGLQQIPSKALAGEAVVIQKGVSGLVQARPLGLTLQGFREDTRTGDGNKPEASGWPSMNPCREYNR